MIEYIKIAIIALVSGFMAPLPVSSSAHFSILNNAVELTSDASKLGFYFSLFQIAFAVMVFICLRKIYFKSIKSVFVGKKSEGDNSKVYKNVAKNI